MPFVRFGGHVGRGLRRVAPRRHGRFARLNGGPIVERR